MVYHQLKSSFALLKILWHYQKKSSGIFLCRNLIKNGMWPTSLWNLGVLLLVLSALLIGDWEFAKPVTSRLDNLEDILHIPRCKFIRPVKSSVPLPSAENLCQQGSKFKTFTFLLKIVSDFFRRPKQRCIHNDKIITFLHQKCNFKSHLNVI